MKEEHTVKNVLRLKKSITQHQSNLMYRPLPDYLTIKISEIEGLGIFAVKDIKANTYLGITHVYNSGFPQNWIRTPLGGHYNHSDEPNCYLKDSFVGASLISTKILITLKNISAGDEITCTYTLYSLDGA